MKNDLCMFTPFSASTDALREANTVGSNAQVFRGVTILQAGLGNKRDRHLYTSKAMREAVGKGLFNNLRAFVDHPTSVDEQVQPERTLRDFAGVYKSPRFVEADAIGPARIVADLHVVRSQKWLAEGIRDLVELGVAESVGISILGSGRTSPTKYRLEESGEEIEVQQVDEFLKVKSADLVTQAGAGGGFSNLLESAREGAKEQSDMKATEILKQIKEAAEAGDAAKVLELTDQLAEAEDADGDEADTDAAADEPKDGDEKPAEEKVEEKTEPVAEKSGDCTCGKQMTESGKCATGKAGKRKMVGKKFAEGVADEKDQTIAEQSAEIDKLNKQIAAGVIRDHIAAKLRESKLPAKTKAKLAGKLSGLTETSAIDAEIAFQEAAFADTTEAALSQFEEVEGAGDRTETRTTGTKGAVEQISECVTGSGLKLKTRK